MPYPVYAFTGFLESGKTKFIQETLCDPRFNAGERTLLLVCEEGEEEYDPSPIPTRTFSSRSSIKSRSPRPSWRRSSASIRPSASSSS